MKLYLSSYRLGNDTEEFKKLVGKTNAKVAIIDNALDCYNDASLRAEKLAVEFSDIESLEFIPEHVDLRDYLNNKNDLYDKLKEFDVVWVRGGNSFILLNAMKKVVLIES